RNATAASQSGAGAGPSSCSTRPSSDSARETTRASAAASTRSRASRPAPLRESGSVVGIDRHVLVREIAGPDHGRRVAAAEDDAHLDLRVSHHALAVLLAILRMASAARGDVHVVELQVDAVDVEIGDAGP